MQTFLVTGATRGLGLAIAGELARRPDTRVVLAVRDLARGTALAAGLGPRVEARALDLASLADVRRFAAAWDRPLAGLVNNAGLQQMKGLTRTPDGLEETVAVNHLAAFALTEGLLPWLTGGRVLFIGSGTHDPGHPVATFFGFRGARFTSIEALARGDTDAPSARQAGMDRYATSKFLDTITAREWARRIPPERTAFLCLDPGMMPGTGLARGQPWPLRAAWNSLLHLVALALPDASTPTRSARTAAWLLTEPGVEALSGTCFSYHRKPSTYVWSRVAEPALGAEVFEQTRAFLARTAPAAGAAPRAEPA